MIRAFKKYLNNQDGASLITFAVTLPVLIGFLAIGLETSNWRKEKSVLQQTADLAAFAGAKALSASGHDYSILSAKLNAIENGYNSNIGTIIVNSPPLSGNYKAQDAVEVIITQNAEQYFSKVILNDSDVTYKVRSVATIIKGGPACALALHPTNSGALTASGSTKINLNECVMGVNSNSPTAASLGGNAALAAECMSIVGGLEGASFATLECGDANVGVASLIDPYAAMRPPNPANYPCKQVIKINKWWRALNAGRYCKNMAFKDRTFLQQPGIYIFDGITVAFKSGFATLEGSGVTIFLMNGARMTGLNGGTFISLTAPKSGPYAGMAIYSDPATQLSGEPVTINGGAGTNIDGVVYFPTQDLTFSGNSSSLNGCVILVASQLEFTGNSGLDVTGCETNFGIKPPTTPTGVYIVE